MKDEKICANCRRFKVGSSVCDLLNLPTSMCATCTSFDVKIDEIGKALPKHKDVSALDVQVGGGHYKDMKIQPVEFITKNNIPFLEGNVIKYVCRHGFKNGIEDLKKAKHYIDLAMELYYDKTNT